MKIKQKFNTKILLIIVACLTIVGCSKRLSLTKTTNHQLLTQSAIEYILAKDYRILTTDSLPAHLFIDSTLTLRPSDFMQKNSFPIPYPIADYKGKLDSIYFEVPSSWRPNIKHLPNIMTTINKKTSYVYFSPLLLIDCQECLPFNYVLQSYSYLTYDGELVENNTWYQFEINKNEIIRHQIGAMSMEIIK